jgi:tripartite-type tricarboxylate transporter receptor subunit TctC
MLWKTLVTLVAATACALGLGREAAAQAKYPDKPIRIVVIVAPGGSADAMARILSEKMSARMGQPVVVENKPGAGGNIAAEHVARATPDGYTLLLTANNHTLNPFLYDKANYAAKDFQAVSELMRGPSVLVTATSAPFNTLGEVIALARAPAAKLSYGSQGIGTPAHIAGELLKQAAQIDILHVPYKGGGPAITAAISGEVPLAITSLVAAMPHIKGGRLKAIAVTSSQRWKTAPDIPAAAETVPGYSHMTWLGLLAPRATPQPIIDTLNREVGVVLNAPEVRERVQMLGGEPIGGSSAAFEQMLSTEVANTRALIKASGIQAE